MLNIKFSVSCVCTWLTQECPVYASLNFILELSFNGTLWYNNNYVARTSSCNIIHLSFNLLHVFFFFTIIKLQPGRCHILFDIRSNTKHCLEWQYKCQKNFITVSVLKSDKFFIAWHLASRDAYVRIYICVHGLVSAFFLTCQVKVRDIHIRYEDGVTNPETLLAAGITLHSLELKVCILSI